MHISLASTAKQLSNVQTMALGISSNKAVFPCIVTVQRAGGLSGRLMVTPPSERSGTVIPSVYMVLSAGVNMEVARQLWADANE